MSLRVLLIHGEGPEGNLHKTTALFGAEPIIDVSVARHTYEIGNHPAPTLILLDLDLARPPALEVLQWLRAQKPYAQIPVIALTSPHTVKRVNRAYELRCERMRYEEE